MKRYAPWLGGAALLLIGVALLLRRKNQAKPLVKA